MDAPANRVHPAVTHRVVTTAGGPLPVTRIDPHEDPGRVFYTAMGYAACTDPFELQRFTLLADRLRARLIVVDTPGCSHLRTRLTARERLALLRSDFTPVAERMLHAARTLDTTTRTDRRVGVLGYSLGASVASRMAAVLRRAGTELDTIVLVEPVGHRRWTTRDLIAATRHEDTHIDRYLGENGTIPGAVAPNDRTPGASPHHLFRPDLALLANALRAGWLPRDLLPAVAGTSTRLVVAHGTSSLLSDPHATTRLLEAARAAQVTVSDLPVPGSHGLWQSLPRVDRLGRQIAATLGDPQ